MHQEQNDPPKQKRVASRKQTPRRIRQSGDAEERLRESEARKAAILEASLDCIIMMDDRGDIVEFNPAAERTFGYSREEAVGSPLVDLIVPPQLRDAHRNGLQRYLATGEGPVIGKRIEVPACHRDGREFPIEIAINVITTQGKPFFTAYLRDISAQKAAEAEQKRTLVALEQANRYIQRITDTTPNIICIFDAETNATIWTNRDVASLLGYGPDRPSPEENNKQRYRLHPEDIPRMKKHIGRLRNATDGQVLKIDYRVQDAQGEWRWLRGRDTIFLRDEANKVLQILGTTEDVNEQRLFEEALRKSEARLRTLIANFPAGVLLEDEQRHIVLTNQQFCEQFAIPAPPEALTGADCSGSAEAAKSLFREPEAFVRGVNHILAVNETVIGEALRMADGRVLERDYVPIQVGGKYRGHLWLYRDITARKADEEKRQELTIELQRSNRELNYFAAVASHDLQEPLRKIQMFGDRLREELEDRLAGDGAEYLNAILSASRRMKVLIDDLLRFSRITTKARPFTPVDLNILIAEVIEDLEARIQQTNGSVSVAPMPTIEADVTQMRQLFQNLIGNALKFCQPGVPPVIGITAETQGIDLPEGVCRLCITDNGIGFDEEYNEVIFEVFERLHEQNRYEGTGIGLAICRKIVERHHGAITAVGQSGRGATFTLLLPLTQKKRNDHHHD